MAKTGIPKNSVFFTANGLSFQLVAGLAAAGLNLALSALMQCLHIPLFMDTLFTAATSFLGTVCGITSAVATHAIYFVLQGMDFPKDIPNLVFMLCNLTVAAGVRILVRTEKRGKIQTSPLHLLALGIVLALVISMEGGVFYVLLITYSEYKVDTPAVSTLIYTLVTQGIPLAASAMLARIPVNLIDKLIAVFGGWGIALIVKRTAKRAVQNVCHKKENDFNDEKTDSD